MVERFVREAADVLLDLCPDGLIMARRVPGRLNRGRCQDARSEAVRGVGEQLTLGSSVSGSLLREARVSGCLMNSSRWSLVSAYEVLASSRE